MDIGGDDDEFAKDCNASSSVVQSRLSGKSDMRIFTYTYLLKRLTECLWHARAELTPLPRNNELSALIKEALLNTGSMSAENMDVDDDDGLFIASTTLTNKHRGNEVTVRPASLDSKYCYKDFCHRVMSYFFTISI